MLRYWRVIGLDDLGSIHDTANRIALAGEPLQDVWNSQGVQNTVTNMQRGGIENSMGRGFGLSDSRGVLCPVPTSLGAPNLEVGWRSQGGNFNRFCTKVQRSYSIGMYISETGRESRGWPMDRSSQKWRG